MRDMRSTRQQQHHAHDSRAGWRSPPPLRRPPAVVLLALAVAAAAPAARAQQPPPPGDLAFVSFADGATDWGLEQQPTCGDPRGHTLLDASGAGAALFDFDGDGDPDLLLLDGATREQLAAGSGAPDRLYRNDGGRFTDLTAAAGLDHRGWSQGVQCGDTDGDGDLDLYIARFGRDVLYRNEGDGTFTDVTTAAGLGAGGWSTAAAFGDLDADGDLDLYVTRYIELDPARPPHPGVDGFEGDCLWRGLRVPCGPGDLPPLADRLYLNDGGGRFQVAAADSGVQSVPARAGTDVRIVDLEPDGDLDIVVANDRGPNFVFENGGGARFTETGLLSGLAYDEDGRATGTGAMAVADLDGDARPEIYAAGTGGEPDLLYANRGAGGFGAGGTGARLAFPTRGARTAAALFADLDNDGDPDLVTVRGERFPEADADGTGTRFAQRDRLYENRDGVFVVVPETGSTLDQPLVGRGVAAGDLDDDGDLDLVVTHLRAPPSLLLNRLDEAPDAGQSCMIVLAGGAAHGARVAAAVQGVRRVWRPAAGGGRCQSDSRVHLGLGWADAADSVSVTWPDGTIEELGRVKAGSEITVRRGTGIVARRWLEGGGLR